MLFRCRVRGTSREGDRIRLSLNWALARRADLVLTGTSLAWGGWSVPYPEIEDAALVRLGPVWWRLVVRAQGEVYQFMLPPASHRTWAAVVDPFWDGPLPFPLRRIDGAFEAQSRALVAAVGLAGVALVLWQLARAVG